MTIDLRPMLATDWARVERIWAEGIATGLATFEATTPAAEAFLASRVEGLSHVALDERHEVVGWVAASRASARDAYRGVVEHSIYVATEAAGRGVGSALLGLLVEESERLGIWTIQSAILVENAASIRLHERAGFRVVGTRERIARTPDGVWHDTVLLERRSARD
ncbi:MULTISPECIES: GNAT family N-acetyltransferase [unclassified Agrococcus]|uniref:GNAT family N-acetyltransferase n=1 Tax=unclassified Agrococcus TaxID=2615065 RepID=UPI00361363D9